MTDSFNKYRAAIEVLQKGRDVLVDTMAEEILEHGPELVDGGFQFNEFLESQGTRLHFLSLLVNQLEQSADSLDEVLTAPRRPRRLRPRRGNGRPGPRPRKSRRCRPRVRRTTFESTPS